VPVRVQIDKQKTIQKTLQDLQDQEIRMIPFEQTGIQRIQRLDQSTADACAFRSLILIQPKEFDDFDGILSELHDSTDTMAAFNSYPLMLQFGIASTQINIEANFDIDSISTSIATRMLQHLMHVLEQVHRKDFESKNISEVALITEEDKNLITSWNKPTFSNEAIHTLGLIEEMVRSQPNNCAVDAWDGSFTYAELLESATGLAAKLRDLGVKQETLVPICFEKSKFVMYVFFLYQILLSIIE